MKITIKGGVWKNTEDEILKVSVMKYGLNQWARISSLLTRKSPAQCKARWYEWLDPSIKKTEWSKEEEEKLLHLAKIFPSQWKTIGPLVGRTASQCLEHYNKLLDAVQMEEAGAEGLSDTTKLRMNEMEMNPETKPAKPDAIDMDEDEKETLSEAKARLSNTHGKKEKRKFREKQLEEARRLAFLQKKRELKAAGIILHDKKDKNKEKRWDYKEEIPFYKKPLAGFYDTTEESKVDPNKDSQFINTRLDEFEKDKQAEEQEQANREAELKKKKREMMNLPEHIKQVGKVNDPEMGIKRTKMVLPAPQLTDEDLEEIAEFEKSQKNLMMKVGDAGQDGSYMGGFKMPSTPMTSKSSMTTARTPMREDTVKMEAQNLLRMTNAQTPLKGGVNPTLNPSDYSGVTPAPQAALKTPLANQQQKGDLIPRTPNTLKSDLMGGMTPKTSSERNQRSIQSLSSKLSQIPKPTNEIELSLPDEAPSLEEYEEDKELYGGGSGSSLNVQDESETDLRRQQQLKHKEQFKLRNRSSTMKKLLPRSTSTQLEQSQISLLLMEEMESQLENEINHLLTKEINDIIINDNINFPISSSSTSSSTTKEYEIFTDKELLIANQLLSKEMKEIQQLIEKEGEEMKREQEFNNVWDNVHNNYMWIQGKYIPVEKVTNEQKISQKTLEYQSILNAMKDMNKKAVVLEKKLNQEYEPHQTRLINLANTIEKLHEEVTQSNIELSCFHLLAENEHRALESRLEASKSSLYDQCDRENRLQMKYAQLLNRRNDLLKQLNQ